MSHGPGGDNPYTRGIAAFVAGLAYERIPTEVIARIKLLILDSLGCALYGTELPWSRILMTTLGGLDHAAHGFRPSLGVAGLRSSETNLTTAPVRCRAGALSSSAFVAIRAPVHFGPRIRRS